MKNYNHVILWLSIISLNSSFGQTNTDGRFRTIQISGHSGTHPYGGERLDEKTISEYGAFELRYAWQNSNPESWASQYGYPSYGIGFYSGFLGDPQIFGNPNALFGFINFPISKPTKRNAFNIEPALGLTYNLEPYNSETNRTNDAIGARLAVYFNLNFGWNYKWTNDMDFSYGIDFTHFSNGRSSTPNWGLNWSYAQVGLKTDGSAADWIEIGRGFRPFKW